MSYRNPQLAKGMPHHSAKFATQKNLTASCTEVVKTSSVGSVARRKRFDLVWKPLHLASLSVLKLLLPAADLIVVSPDRSRTVVGALSSAPTVIRFNNYSCLPRILLRPLYAPGWQYVHGGWDVESGRLADALAMLIQRANRFERKSSLGSVVFGFRRLLFLLRQRYGVSRSFSNVEQHYDVGNDLFSSFLDSRMVYSCADFQTGDLAIEDAQRIKLDKTIERLQLQPGHRLLEIGSGWGSLSFLAATEHKAKVTALTLSRNQLEYSKNFAKEHGDPDQLAYLLEDYREHLRRDSPRYDRIVSVGMAEHVGLRQMGDYFSAINCFLEAGGFALVHTIVRKHPGVTNPWIDRHIFPGGYIATEDEILRAAAAHGLKICDRTHRYDAPNYILTLRHWARRLNRSWSTLLKYKYPEEVRRTYDFYFAGSEAAFRQSDMYVMQFVFRKAI
ncbi:cyclopropane-fatty-acyl-phospholipid synthase family protein [Bradyrhizobium sp.]|uniref:SAM-dependent methyltransferase n=1 Tax=Bradyrhizobium sp. TaxID=376 RepID=UPI0027325377|nr:cyclopropane-fatty-acyl-phospholipid synthase family protein [Bradyrhizobium sp.]MDP3077505.1 cyclopropane-fatty-acyl-phospholipid synthase family protein [Bradyrhizobium sp.]